MRIILHIVTLALFALPSLHSKADDSLDCYELRIYHTHEGKLDALHARFRDHTLALFEKHGISNLVYWTPKENPDGLLIYLVGYPDEAARDASWKAFRDDPDWKAAYKASTADGKLVKKVDSLILTPTDYSPALDSLTSAPFFEMRKYTTNAGKLDDLDARFRDHTVSLFEKHGIKNLPYFHLESGQEGAETTLLYFISSESEKARNASFKAFSQDPEWKAAREASEKDGKLLVKKGVQSTFLVTTDYSPVK